jgi:ribosomal protein S18 acetylase RimI-like enzyme
MNDPKLREMTIADYDDVVSFWRGQDGVGLNDSDEREPIATFLARNPGLSPITRDGAGRVIAAVLCGHNGRCGELHHLAVSPAHRRRGLGRRIVRECLRRLADQGILRCNIFLFTDNADGERFWRALGFRHRAELKTLQRPTKLEDA